VRDWKDAPASSAQPSSAQSSSAQPSSAEPVRALVRRAASAGVFQRQHFAPGADLEPWVESLWTVDWDVGAETFDSAVISYPAMHLTAEWGPAGEVRHGHRLPATLVHGVVSRVFQVRLSGAGGVVGARFTPSGFASWAGVDAASFTDRAVRADEVLADGLDQLPATLAEIGEPDERAELFRAALAHRVRSGHPLAGPPDQELDALVARMASDSELVRAEQVAELAGWSLRTLQRRFRAEVGVSPKWVLARFRLQEAALALEQDPDVDLAGLAVRLGWYDQPHLTKDFRRLLGETPGLYAALVRQP
jgi:AraC-like DNA-binding protein